jgi:1-acyl-sn-glycerol-3-phosphate acyltransferase
MSTVTPAIEDIHDDGLGYDHFGLHRPSVLWALRLGAPAFERYFRVESDGVEHVPREGPAILVANHGGVLPVDAAMLWLDVARRTGRILRPIADRFVPSLPIIGTQLTRVGVVSGTRDNVRRLLERGELLAIFPEGVSGTGKPFHERYHLQAWNTGHAELAIRHRAPVIPVAIIGAEESWPLVARLAGLHPFGAPYVPVPATPLPLPVPLHLHYGAPLALHLEFPDADDSAMVDGAAARVHNAVAALIAAGLARRADAAHLT